MILVIIRKCRHIIMFTTMRVCHFRPPPLLRQQLATLWNILSTVTMVERKPLSCHHYLRYCHSSGTNVFRIPICQDHHLSLMTPLLAWRSQKLTHSAMLLYSWDFSSRISNILEWTRFNKLVPETWSWSHMMALGMMNAMVSFLWQYFRCWWNDTIVSYTMITFDRL